MLRENVELTWKVKRCLCGAKLRGGKHKTRFCRACRLFFFNLKRWRGIDVGVI